MSIVTRPVSQDTLRSYRPPAPYVVHPEKNQGPSQLHMTAGSPQAQDGNIKHREVPLAPSHPSR